MIGLLEVVVLAGSLLAAMTWVAVALVAPRQSATGLRGVGSQPLTPPAQRLGSARAWLYAPIWVPALLVGAALIPGLLGALVAHADHCVGHASVHHHLCLLHPPHAADSAVAWALPLALLLPAAAFVALCVRRAARDWRLTRTLVATSRASDLGEDVRLLDNHEPLAATVGWRRPTILLSSGLLRAVSDHTRAVVLAHERAHVARGDTLLALCDRLAASLLPRAVAATLLGRIALAREQACDALAAEQAGGHVAVARALTEIARLRMTPPATGVSVASGSLELRVAHLLRPPPRSRRPRLLHLAWLLPALALGAGPIHSVLEHLISAVLH